MAEADIDPNGTAFAPSGPGNSEHLWRLTRNLLDLQKSGKFCDLQLLCQDGSLTAHSVVLASACDTLQATIQHQHMHLPMMDYSLETVQRMVTFLYTGHIDPPPPHEEMSFQNLMNSMGLPHTQPDDIGDFMSSSVYPVTSPTRIEQDIKPQLIAGQAIEGGSDQVPKKVPNHLAPVVSLVQLNLDTFEDDDDDDDDDDEEEEEEEEMEKINIKQEIESDEEPSTPPEAQTPDIERISNRGRKRKAIHDDDYEYGDNQEAEYAPVQRVPQKRKSTPKRAPAKARKSMKSSNRLSLNTTVHKTEDGDENSNEQYDESQSFAEEGDSSLMEDQKPQLVPKPKKKVLVRQCEHCGYQTCRLQRLETHYLKQHGVPYLEQNARRVISRKPIVHHCPFEGCEYQAGESSELRTHVMVHDPNYYVKESYKGQDGHLVQCEICGTVVSRISYHIKSQHDFKLIECKYCGRMIKDCNMTKHVKVKHLTGTQLYICPTCGYKCTDYHIFKFHCVTKHGDTSFGSVKVYTCEYCGLKSKGQYNLNTHIKAVHLGEKDVLCDICGSSFRTEQTMLSHRKIHSKDGEMQSCPHPGCTYTTNVEGYIKRHVNIHHKDNKEWACKYCDYTCKQRGNIRLHLLRKHKLSEQDAIAVMECVVKVEVNKA